MSVPEALSRVVRSRARGRCQYCLMQESLQGATFHIEHIIPQSKGGNTELENLALACPRCNLLKAARVMAVDPATRQQVPLFHPCQQRWANHFEVKGYRIEGSTATGRATVIALDLNHPRRLRVRQVEELFGLYPPL